MQTTGRYTGFPFRRASRLNQETAEGAEGLACEPSNAQAKGLMVPLQLRVPILLRAAFLTGERRSEGVVAHRRGKRCDRFYQRLSVNLSGKADRGGLPDRSNSSIG
jgi:hypothetical protein